MISIRTSVGLLGEHAIKLARSNDLVVAQVGKEFDGGWFWIESHEGRLLDAVLDIADRSEGASFRLRLDCSNELVARAPYFQLFPGPKLRLSERDEDELEARFREADLGESGRVMLLETSGLRISCKCEPKKLFSLIEGYNEIALHPDSAQELMSLTESITCVNLAGKESDLCYLIEHRKYAPRIELDSTVTFFDKNHKSEGWPVQAGFLSLKERIETPGIYRLVDPLNATENPGWVVTRCILDEMERLGFKINRKYPAFDFGSDLHKAYLATWEPFIGRISANSNNVYQIW